MRIGERVKVVNDQVSNKFNGREGTITSFGTGVIPVHVTFDGEKHETDFAEKELIEVKKEYLTKCCDSSMISTDVVREDGYLYETPACKNCGVLYPEMHEKELEVI